VDATSQIPQITPSPLCNYLLELARRVKEGSSTRELLKEVVEEQLGRLAQAREATMSQIRAQGEEHMRRFAGQISDLQYSFTEMEGALRALGRFGESPTEDTYQQAVARLTHAGHVSQAAMDQYQRAELEQGPTKMPLINLLYRLKDAYLEGRATAEDLATGVKGAAAMARAAADEVRARQPLSQDQQALVEAYEALAAAIESLQAAASGGRAAMDRALEEIATAGGSVRRAAEEHVAAVASQGPTPMVHHNFILNLAAAQERGEVTMEVLARGLEVFRTSMQDMQAETERLASLPSDNPRIAEEMARLREVYAMHWQALEDFERYVGGDPSALASARERLIAAGCALAECKRAFDQIGEMEGKVPCVKCGTPNPVDGRRCSACGTPLIVPAGMATSSATTSFLEEGGQAQLGGELVMTENLLKLFQAVNDVAEDKIGAQEFDEVLNWMAGLVQQNLLHLPAAPELSRKGLTEEQAEQVARAEESLAAARSDIEQGAHDFLGALEEMRRFLDDADKDHLVSGVRQARDAAIKIQKAQQVIDEIAAASAAARASGAEPSAAAEEAEE
jgi:hypothetical protein